jgi:membrane protease YdiL (CAAX protease family)
MKNKAYLYIAAVIILSYGWQLLIYLTGELESKLLYYLMFLPAIIAIFIIIISKQGFRKIGWGFKKWYYIFPAIFVPFLVFFIALFLVKVFGWGSFSSDKFTFPLGIFQSSGLDAIIKGDSQTIPLFDLKAVIPFILLFLYGTLVALGEEIGWRGYLQEKLIKKHGLFFGLLVLGVVWAYWHLPVYLMGLSFPSHPIIGPLLLSPMYIILVGVFLGWLYIKSGSIWIPALGHASVNLLTVITYSLVVLNTSELTRFFIVFALWGIVAILCYISLKRDNLSSVKNKADNKT